MTTPNTLDIQYHTSTTSSWEAMMQACENARESILIEEYVLDPDRIGTSFIECLVRKAKEGVKVRVLVDWWGSKALETSWQRDKMKAAGIELLFFNPVRWHRILLGKVLPRDHRKIFVVDDEVVFIGGVCVYDDIKDWRDTMLEVRHPKVTQHITALFENTWQRANGENGLVTDEVYHRDDTETGLAIYANTPLIDKQAINEELYDQIRGATKHIGMTTPYFTPGATLIALLKDAVGRGVKVEILLSDYSKYAPYVVGKHLCGELIDAGVNIHYYTPSMLHLKLMLIDDKWAAIGSCNLDGLSFNHNEEVMLITKEQRVIDELTQHFNEDKRQSRAFSFKEWNARPLSQKVAGLALLPLRKYL